MGRSVRLLTLVLLVAATAPAGAATSAAPAFSSANGGGVPVTLVTGDRITVEAATSGCGTARIEPASPKAVIRQVCGPDGHLRIYPASVAPLIGSKLDPAL